MSGIVRLMDVVKDYPLGKVTVHALRKVNLTIDKGEFTVIAGPSGSGKTTLLNLIGCIDVATAGEVLVDGKSTGKLTDKQLTSLRLNSIGFIFQSFNLINVLDIRQNVEFPLLLQGGLSKAERQARVDDVVDKVGLRQFASQRPNELSGGQRQRVAIARALVTRPAIVLADEPTANLDSTTGTQIIDLMKEINHQDHTTFIFSTHDEKVMKRADRVVRILDGMLEAAGLSESRGPSESGGEQVHA
ncbi:MAG: ABC transporter ATP-binding protein [Pseudomonadota bacterium]|nr:ABC transporter ATP-binding protein [Pseudomonadota bacterium]